MSDCVNVFIYIHMHICVYTVCKNILKGGNRKKESCCQTKCILFIYLLAYFSVEVLLERKVHFQKWKQVWAREAWLRRPKYILIQGVNEDCYIMIRVSVRNRNVQCKVLNEVVSKYKKQNCLGCTETQTKPSSWWEGPGCPCVSNGWATGYWAPWRCGSPHSLTCTDLGREPWGRGQRDASLSTHGQSQTWASESKTQKLRRMSTYNLCPLTTAHLSWR